MHELGIVFHLMDLVEQVAEEHELSSVARVHLRLGEVSGVLPDYLQDCWRWAADKQDLTRGAELDVEQVDAVTLCHACGTTYGTVEHGRTCPTCGSPDTVLVSGLEIELVTIEGS